MKNEIRFLKKPSSVSFDKIHEILWAAHESTRANGMQFSTAEMSGKELEDYIKTHNATCYVAMDGDKVIGTNSCYLDYVNKGAIKGRFVKEVLVGILPEYKGQGIYSRLFELAVTYAKENKADGMVTTTFAKNKKMQQIKKKQGFVYTRHFIKDGHFSVGGYLCFKDLPHSKIYYNLCFLGQKAKSYSKWFIRKIKTFFQK